MTAFSSGNKNAPLWYWGYLCIVFLAVLWIAELVYRSRILEPYMEYVVIAAVGWPLAFILFRVAGHVSEKLKFI
jgi:hypothetical protein